jgi:nicotinamide-nucleotide amidase
VTSAAGQIHELLRERGETIATAESLTAGLVGAALTDTAGSSATYRGGLIVYATDLKTTLAGVPAGLLDERGPVDPDVAAAMATGVRDRLAADWGLALTGVAGPDRQHDKPVGLVYVAVAAPGTPARVSELTLPGDRPAIRTAARDQALARLLATLGGR